MFCLKPCDHSKESTLGEMKYLLPVIVWNWDLTPSLLVSMMSVIFQFWKQTSATVDKKHVLAFCSKKHVTVSLRESRFIAAWIQTFSSCCLGCGYPLYYGSRRSLFTSCWDLEKQVGTGLLTLLPRIQALQLGPTSERISWEHHRLKTKPLVHRPLEDISAHY